jgi:hypothetical protein
MIHQLLHGQLRIALADLGWIAIIHDVKEETIEAASCPAQDLRRSWDRGLQPTTLRDAIRVLREERALLFEALQRSLRAETTVLDVVESLISHGAQSEAGALGTLTGRGSDRLVSAAEMAAQLGYSAKTLRNLKSKGVLVAGVHYEKPRSKLLFHLTAMLEWAAGLGMRSSGSTMIKFRRRRRRAGT